MTQSDDSTQTAAFVTGASSEIGAATAAALAQDGWQVTVAARRKDTMEKVAAGIGGTAIELDVRSDDSVANLAAQVDHVDLLVNDAGGAKGFDPALLDKLIASEGHIINTVSMAAFTPYVGGAGCNVAKFGEGALTRVLRLEHVGDPIRVPRIDPGRVETDFSPNRFDGDGGKAAKV